MTHNIGFIGCIQSTSLELLDNIPYEPGTSDDYFNPCGRQCPIGIGATVARQHKSHAFLIHQLRRLNAGAAT